MSNTTQKLDSPALPDLPNPQDRYDRLTVAQTNGLLRTFFLRLSSALTTLFGPAGAQFIDSPNGLFFSTAAQTLAATNTGYAVTFNETYLNNSVSIASSSRVTCAVGGIYNFQFSAQAKSTSGSSKHIFLWIKRSGTNIGYSSRQTTMSGSGQHIPLSWNFSIDMSANQYIEFMWAADSTSVTLEATTATSPHTGIPSAVLAVNYVAPLPATLPTPP
jgi:hypothetical protein